MKGQGVQQDYESASHWFRLASQQGLAVAMHKLAKLYTSGDGVPKDLELAYVWYSVAVAHKHQKSTTLLTEARAKLSSQELVVADQLIGEYLKQYGPKENKTKDLNNNTAPTQ
ncbi:hypothetical protein SPBRAN_1264 [uncultured Candidatus Thioglobus sp.]|nr:hypothetical protein SPBRAN_1264 [uncultured Candidatus Thioglobus sp.]